MKGAKSGLKEEEVEEEVKPLLFLRLGEARWEEGENYENSKSWGNRENSGSVVARTGPDPHHFYPSPSPQ